MASNAAISVTSLIVVTLFVLLVYPAIIPVNAPPVLKTFKDIFVAVLVVAVVLVSIELFISNRNELFSVVPESVPEAPFALCTLRC